MIDRLSYRNRTPLALAAADGKVAAEEAERERAENIAALDAKEAEILEELEDEDPPGVPPKK